MTKQVYSGYRIHLQANQLGIPAIPQTIKGACRDIVQSLKEGPLNFKLDELNRLLNNNVPGGGGGGDSASISIALADIATENPPGTWTLDEDYTLAVGTTLTIAPGITFIIPDSPDSLTLTVNGTLQVSNGGTITTLGTLINNSNQTVQVDEFALFTIDGGTCVNNGTFTNDGRLDISNGGSLEVAEGSTIENNGDVYVYGTNSNIQIAGDATFTNSGGLYASDGTLIGGEGQITGTGTQGSESPPVCDAQTFTSPLEQDETVEICQTFTVDPGTTFTIPAFTTFTNNGIMTVCGELIINGTFINNAYVNFDLSGAICKIYKDGVDTSGNFINNGTCINNGSIYIYDDGTLENNGIINNTAGYIYRGDGDGDGECGTGIITGTIQGTQPVVGCPPVPPTQTPSYFAYTGALQTYTVAADGTITAYVYGAGGGGGGCPSALSGYVSAKGGCGGYATGTFTVSQGQLLNIIVGGAGNGGTKNNSVKSGATLGGYGGGGNGGVRADDDSYDGGGGGGYSGIYIGANIQANYILIAGGGGGGGGKGDSDNTPRGVGGSGGGSAGTGGSFPTDGTIYPASAGKHDVGGIGWATSSNTDGVGTELQGGSAQPVSGNEGGGGGGGGGYYGGGGGRNSRGGGGGSGYIGINVTDGQLFPGSIDNSGGKDTIYYPTDGGSNIFNIGFGVFVWAGDNEGGNGLVVLEFTPN